jgi:hypothetical protein
MSPLDAASDGGGVTAGGGAVGGPTREGVPAFADSGGAATGAGGFGAGEDGGRVTAGGTEGIGCFATAREPGGASRSSRPG